MGVVYKIKPEIIELILQEKEANPLLSCRSLVMIVKKKFDIELSKSSINSIIKKAGLSSNVGRKKHDLSQPEDLPLEPQSKPPPKEDKETLLLEAKKRPKLLEQKEEKSLPIEVHPEPAAAQEPKIKVGFKDLDIKEDTIYPCMGSFFLKAAQLELSNKPILAEILDTAKPKEFFKEAGLVGDALLFMPIFDITDPAQISSKYSESLGILTNQKLPIEGLIPYYLKQLQDVQGLSLNMQSKCSQLFRGVNSLKIFLEDDTHFYIDARFKSIWQKPGISNCLSSTYYKTMSYINNLFIENSQPIILLTASGYNSFQKILSEFIYACQMLPDKKILKIALYDNEQNEIHKFLDIPQQKRDFIFGIWPWQKECIKLIKKNASKTKSFYCEEILRDIYYIDGQMEIVQHLIDEPLMLRFALLKDSPITPVRIGVLSNISEQDKSIEEIIKMYLARWPNLEEGYQDFLKRQQPLNFADLKATPLKRRSTQESGYTLPETAVNVREELDELLNRLNNYAQECFFPKEYIGSELRIMKERFYSLPGRISRRDGRFIISLTLPDNYGFGEDLLYAIKRLNESDIRDHLNAKICLSQSKESVA